MIIDGVGLAMWTIYDHPKDFPEHFVARKWLITGGEDRPRRVSALSWANL
jgi:hypothetical protein